MGVSQLDLTGMQVGRRVQAWLYDSLNKGLLAGRIQALMLMSDLLEDWYFSWGLLRTEGSLQDVLMELVKVAYLNLCSSPMNIRFPLFRTTLLRLGNTWVFTD